MVAPDWQAPELTREQRIAERVWRRAGRRPPLDVRELAADFADLEEASIPGECDGLILGLQPGGRSRPLIVVKRLASSARKRFTIAHELGHLLLPWHLGSSSACGIRFGDIWSEEAWQAQQAETEANRFASALLVPPSWIDEMVGQHGADDLAAVMAGVRQARVSAHVACIALSQRLPPGRLFVIEASDGSTVLSGSSPDSSAQLPYVGDRADFTRLDRFADDRVSLTFGSQSVRWWTYTHTAVEPADDPRATREILDSLLSRYARDAGHAAGLRQSFGGVAGAAKSMSTQRAGQASEQQIYMRLRRAFAKQRDEVPDEMLDDPDFELWLRRRAFEMAE